MPVPNLLLALEKKNRKPEKRFWLISRILQSYHRITDTYSKWPTESGLVGQGTLKI